MIVRRLTYMAFILSLLGTACGKSEPQAGVSAAIGGTTSIELEEDQSAEAVTARSALSYTERKGKVLYDKYCAVCHGIQGQGDGFNAYNLDPKPGDLTEEGYLATLTDDWLLEVITQGGRGVKRSVLMPAYEKTLTRSQMKDVLAYLRFLAREGIE